MNEWNKWGKNQQECISLILSLSFPLSLSKRWNFQLRRNFRVFVSFSSLSLPLLYYMSNLEGSSNLWTEKFSLSLSLFLEEREREKQIRKRKKKRWVSSDINKVDLWHFPIYYSPSLIPLLFLFSSFSFLLFFAFLSFLSLISFIRLKGSQEDENMSKHWI